MFTIRKTILITLLQFTTTQTYRNNKPLAENLWSERCVKNSIVLNDCNWCRCNAQKYDCKARVCEEIDLFGHFKDAIQEIDVGMEGHGSWRSRPSSCTPGVKYRRAAVLCVCDGDGNWPNPVCRDLFQILHTVELTDLSQITQNDSCTPTKLYLVGCNVCFCPSSGLLDPQMCTVKECQDDDPALESNDPSQINISPNNDGNDGIGEVSEIYATCDPQRKYKVGCRNCDCLSNNRLLCGNCSVVEHKYSNIITDYMNSERSSKVGKYGKKKLGKTDISNSICNGKKPLQTFTINCNTCHCSGQLKLFCTIKKCLKKTQTLQSSFKAFKKELSVKKFKEVTGPPDDISCTPGTRFKRDCNICVCDKTANGIKHVTCTRLMCKNWGSPNEHAKVIDRQNKDCVVGTFYKQNCMLCHCFMKEKVKHENCKFNEKCVKDFDAGTSGGLTLQGIILEDYNSLHGFCVPMRRYKNDCNICRCLSDGKTVECTSKVCSLRSSDFAIDIVPVVVENGERCPDGHSYRLDCNLCFCLSNGNAICTTYDCSKFQLN